MILPKSVTHSRIEENRDIYDFELSKEDMDHLNTGKYEPSAWVSRPEDYLMVWNLLTDILSGSDDGTTQSVSPCEAVISALMSLTRR